MKPAPDRIYDTLKRYWGFTEFRPVQLEIIRSVLEGRDTLALMPTGGGKSLTYQVPTLAREGLCIVVTPLIALMKNQVDSMRTFSAESGIAHFLNSSLNKTAVQQVRSDVLEGRPSCSTSPPNR